MRRFSKQSIKLSFACLMIMLCLLLVIVVPKVLGFTITVVTTDAMMPTYAEGTVLFVKNVTEDNLVVGNEVTYYINQGKEMQTRRIVAIEDDQSMIYTIGDNQHQLEQSGIKKSQLIGQPIFSIPYVGELVHQRTITVVFILYGLFALYVLAATIFVTLYQIKTGSLKRTISY